MRITRHVRPTRKIEELRGASKHLHYEVAMFFILARALASGVFGEGILHNAVLESFIIHARILLDFLFLKARPQDDDVVAEDYLSEWTEIRGEMPPILTDLRFRVGKRAAHLTYSRLAVGSEEKPWEFLKIVGTLEGVLDRFITKVSKEKLAEEWKMTEEQR